MFKIRILIRNLIKDRLSTVFSVVSFSIAFCCAVLVYLLATDEMQFDKYNANFEQTYRLNVRAIDGSNMVNCSFPGVYNDNLGSVTGIEKYARLQLGTGERYISVNNEPFIETNILFGDPEILKILDFEFLVGDPEEALQAPLSMILSESIARKYFGDQDAMGRLIHLDNHDFTITGIVKDLPEQSHFRMNMLASVSSYKVLNNNLLTKWYMTAFNYYFLIPGDGDFDGIENQLTELFAKGHKIADEDLKFQMYLEPLADIHLRSAGTLWDNAIKGDYKVVIGVVFIAFLIWTIATTNYINTLTANYRKKIKETGIRRVNGASRFILGVEQGFETLVLLIISLLLSLCITALVLPYVNIMTGKSMELGFSLFGFLTPLILVSALLSTAYPILFFNSFKPSEAIKSQVGILKRKGIKQQQKVRGAFVVFQLGIATFLIVAVVVVSSQLQLVLETKTGFDKENVLVVTNPYSENMNQRYDRFKGEIEKLPLVDAVGVTQNAPAGYINNYSPVRLPGQDVSENQNIAQIVVDHDFLEAVGARFITGRNFDEKIELDKRDKIVINQSAVDLLRLENPVGEKLAGLNNAFTPNGELEIIGVIEDMQYFTLKESAKPIMYYIRDWGHHNIVIRLHEGDYSQAVASMKSVWSQIAPEYPFSMQFMDARISSNYQAEINTAKTISVLSGIAILLSILGILGMIVFTIQHRTKEIGIRKVNGAKISEILALLNRDFVKWVAIAFVIACPIAYYAMSKWLENFAYKTSLSWWIFALAGVLALGIALLTVSWQSWRAATRNPVEALRYE
ncbi:ABC transporter permease [Sunxiuqinia elliptica]|uniref:Putative ABC transport system permease protein n=1 Tax=Sunxiuqinia elliptica TaxID=655355 RepID=A0A1I2AH84_9BACT|nr:ABC transporter permease [Sunxiuqinia elliptica]SFE43129.1 putative ABC transport system permease protein [Sunxiuqinia elliptica]